jgi:hypothetical protein
VCIKYGVRTFPSTLLIGPDGGRIAGQSGYTGQSAEAWVAATVNGAAALGLAGETGQLAPGFRADVAVHAVDDYRALPYWFGERLCVMAWAGGRPCHPWTSALASAGTAPPPAARP